MRKDREKREMSLRFQRFLLALSNKERIAIQCFFLLLFSLSLRLLPHKSNYQIGLSLSFSLSLSLSLTLILSLSFPLSGVTVIRQG